MLRIVVAALAAILMVVSGNIDLDSRQAIVNADGTISTECSFSVEIDGLEVLLPTVVDGSIVSEEKAIENFYRTGKHLGMFSCSEAAELYAFWLHLRQEAEYGE